MCEGQLESGLRAAQPDLKLAALLEALPQFFGARGAALREASGAGASFDVLMSLTEYTSFRDMMLAANRERASADRPDALLAPHAITLPPGIPKDLAAFISSSGILEGAASEAGWEEVTKTAAFTMSRRKAGGKLLFRIVQTLEVPSAVTHLLWADPELRMAWDDMAKKVERVSGTAADGVLRVCMKFPLMATREVYTHICRVENFPSPGVSTSVIAPVTDSASLPPVPRDMVRQDSHRAVTVVAPDPAAPATRTRQTMYMEPTESSAVPQWLMGRMMAMFMPRMMAKVESGYAKLHAAGRI